jgi:nucleoside-triphosphatase THEP1
MKLIITGSPEVGRTSLCLRVVDFCLQNGLKVGGMVSKESCSGLEVCDFESGAAGLFLRNEVSGIAVGPDLSVLESIGTTAIGNAVSYCDVVLIDCIGEAQMRSKEFRQICYSAFGSDRHLIVSVEERFAGTFAKISDCSVDISKEGVQKCYERMLSLYGDKLKSKP